ncbi:hypothetical protein KIN20_030242 [Parelaphostrongylus tenuis]|uniref:Uncharacterized protein n=1 Tax=Parelaphostrongylus tenuis TaxID=148309 RepID=A0AAD5WGN9_PARTN|nr:hypothetical protein KIN20_030242 [Parelaphostrongylus tenuis]
MSCDTGFVLAISPTSLYSDGNGVDGEAAKLADVPLLKNSQRTVVHRPNLCRSACIVITTAFIGTTLLIIAIFFLYWRLSGGTIFCGILR